MASVERKSFLEVLQQILTTSKDTPNSIWIATFVIGILLSYVLGYMFFRQEPKRPDQRSFRRLKKKRENQSDATSKDNLGCATEADCEFPYPNLDLYLKKRGLNHLLPLVLWKSEDSKNLRSKTYINLLKIRLHHYFPEKARAVVRNEAHVRLASSTWYVGRTLMRIGVVGVAISGIAVWFAWQKEHFPTLLDVMAAHLPTSLLPVLVTAIGWFCKYRIEEFLHYQRLREVFFVLETAYTAFRDHPERLNPPFKEYSGSAKKLRGPSFLL